MKNLRNGILIALAASAVGFAAAGCGSSDADTKKAMVTDASTVDKNKEARAIFDKVGGDQSKLTADDQAKLKSLYGPTIDITGLFAAMSRKVTMGGKGPGR